MRRQVGFIVLILVAIGFTTACGGGHRPPQMPSEAPRVFQQEVVVPSCWDPVLRSSYSDWFNNEGSATPTQVTVEDLKVLEDSPNRVVCRGVLKAGETLRGPAIWAHRSDTTEWSVVGKSYVTVVSLDRKRGVVDMSDADMLYSKGYGWYFRCSTCNINNHNEEEK